MPNHITNIIKASPEVIAALRSEKAVVDFNTMVPMPPSLQGVSENGDGTLVEFLNGLISISPAPSNVLGRLKLSNALRDIEDGGVAKWDAERFENFVQMLRNYKAYGYVSWLDFGNAKWNTKWNAYSIVESDGACIQFDTAWDAPHPVLEALAAKFPHICIEHLWASEDIGGSVFGHRRYCEAVTDLPIDDPIDFALTVTGQDREYYRANPTTGKWEYFDADEQEDAGE